MTIRFSLLLLFLGILESEAQRGLAFSQSSSSHPEGGKMVFQIESPAFEPEGTIPGKYTCDGSNVSPPLRWSNAPANTASFALIVDDPDAPVGTFTHWLLWGLQPERLELPEGISQEERLAEIDEATQGENDFGRVGYGGPCPPPGPAHRYRFHFYALDQPIALKPGATRSELLQALEGKILEMTTMTGRYSR